MSQCAELTLWVSILTFVVGMLLGAVLPEWCCKKTRARRRGEVKS